MDGLSRRSLACLFALALAARVAVLPWTLPRYAWGRAYADTAQYEAMARGLRSGQGLVSGPDAQAARPPLYPLMLALFQSLLGEGRACDAAVVAFQCLLAAGACVLTGDLGARLFGAAAGRLSGAAVSLHPELVLYPSLLLTETLAVLLVAAALWACALAWRRGGEPAWAALCGALCGAAALTRASLLPLAAVLALWMALVGRPASAGLCLAAALAVLLPWTLRNHARLGAWVPVTTKAGWDLYEQHCDEANGGPIYETIRWPPRALELGEVEADRFLRRAAWAWICEHPGRTARLALRRLARFWNPLPNDPGHRTPGVFAVSFLANAPLFALALLSLGAALRTRPAAWALAASAVLLLTAVHAVFMGSVRYRAPALAGVAVLAAAAAARPVRP